MEMRRIYNPEIDWYQDLFRRIGEDMLWFSRTTLAEDSLISILENPLVEIHALHVGGIECGLLELDFRREGECELTYLGLTSDFVGTGAGRWLMSKAIDLVWSHPIRRFWLHTCTLDHPRALQFYLHAGFTAYKREIEIADDPRLTGALRRDATPDVPVIEN